MDDSEELIVRDLDAPTGAENGQGPRLLGRSPSGTVGTLSA